MNERCYDCGGRMLFSDEYDFVGWYCPACWEREEQEARDIEEQEAEEEEQWDS